MTTATASRRAATYVPVLVATSSPQTDGPNPYEGKPTGRTEHYLTLEGAHYYGPNDVDHWVTPHYFEIQVEGDRHRYHASYIGPYGTVHNTDAKTGAWTPGKHSTGPYAFLTAQATVLSAYHDPIETVVLTVAPGDTVVIRGQRFAVKAAERSHEYADLTYVGPQFP